MMKIIQKNLDFNTVHPDRAQQRGISILSKNITAPQVSQT